MCLHVPNTARLVQYTVIDPLLVFLCRVFCTKGAFIVYANTYTIANFRIIKLEVVGIGLTKSRNDTESES